MSTDREDLTELKEAFWKDPEEAKEETKPLNENVEEGHPADAAPESAPVVEDAPAPEVPAETPEEKPDEEAPAPEPKVGDGEAGDGGGEG